MKFKDAIASGLCLAVVYGGVAVFGAVCALWGHSVGKEDGKVQAYTKVLDELDKATEELKKKAESEKEES